MKLFGFEITRVQEKAAPIPMSPAWQPGWFPIIREPFTGAWQRNQELADNTITSFHAVFSCLTLIASDISKLRVKFIRENNGVWQEDKSSAYDPVLRRPNKMQNSIQYWENYILSKLQRGNTYVLKERDNRGVVVQLYILDPTRVRPMVTDNGEVFYELQQDNFSDIQKAITVPAREIIHDRMNCFWHPLCGIPPLYAAWLAASQGMAIQQNAVQFFNNRSVPGGILSAPGRIAETTVNHLRDQWEQNFGGNNTGKIAILGDGLKFEPMSVTAHDAQMLEQAKATAEWVCSVFHVPPYKIGVGPTPSYNNVQALNVEYYSQCLQSLIEAAETCLDQGLEMGPTVGVEFDLEGLLRMDTVSQIQTLRDATGAGLISPNEARAKLGYAPVEGGESPMVQQQYYSLAALAERDQDKPFAKPEPAPVAADAAPPPEEEEDDSSEGGPEQERAGKVAHLKRALLRNFRSAA